MIIIRPYAVGKRLIAGRMGEVVLDCVNVTVRREVANCVWPAFINVVDNDHLDARHTVFGRIVSGMDIVRHRNFNS